jgi:hypothetical protein
MLLLRDYGLYDMVQLRFGGSAVVPGEQGLYRRGDGALRRAAPRLAPRAAVGRSAPGAGAKGRLGGKRGRPIFCFPAGTLAFFFERQALQEMVESAGFEALRCGYARTALRNRRMGEEMRRVFVHGVFRRTG